MSGYRLHTARKLKIWRAILCISVILFGGLPGVGIFTTIVSLLRALDTMGLAGGEDPQVLAEKISLSIMSTLGAAVVSLLVLPAIIIPLVMIERTKKQEVLHKPTLDESTL